MIIADCNAFQMVEKGQAVSYLYLAAIYWLIVIISILFGLHFQPQNLSFTEPMSQNHCS